MVPPLGGRTEKTATRKRRMTTRRMTGTRAGSGDPFRVCFEARHESPDMGPASGREDGENGDEKKEDDDEKDDEDEGGIGEPISGFRDRGAHLGLFL